MQTKQDVLQQCTVENNVVKLPAVQLERKLYQEVAKALEGIGGKWNKKAGGFSFAPGYEDEINSLLGKIAGGEKVNLKKEYQFFATPDDIADWLVELAKITTPETVLEPSAGDGAIIKAIWRKHGKRLVFGCEAMPQNIKVLQGLGRDVDLISTDFLETYPPFLFDKIIANPPFSNNQDIDHIRKMYEVCKPGGRIVSVASTHWLFTEGKKEKKFRDWLKEIGAATHTMIRPNAFKESGTMVATVVIVINKK